MASSNSPTNTAVIPQMTAMDITKNEEFVIHGPTEPSLEDLTTGKLLQQQVDRHPDKLAVVSRWQNGALTYQSLFDSNHDISQALLVHGVRPSDRVVILAGNSLEYVQLFFGVGGLGSVFTIINATFTAEEVLSTIDFIGWACFFLVSKCTKMRNIWLTGIAQPQRRFLLPTELGTAITNPF